MRRTSRGPLVTAELLVSSHHPRSAAYREGIVFSSACYSEIDVYACPAWWGFTTAHDRQRMESVIRRGVRFGFCSTSQGLPGSSS